MPRLCVVALLKAASRRLEVQGQQVEATLAGRAGAIAALKRGTLSACGSCPFQRACLQEHQVNGRTAKPENAVEHYRPVQH